MVYRPPDGTSDFARGGPDYVVMIGFCRASQPVMGVVYHPVTQTFGGGPNHQTRSGPLHSNEAGAERHR